MMITGHATVETAVEAMKAGAHDYIAKPFSPAQLNMVVVKAWEHSALVRENVALRQELEIRQGFEGIIGESRPMERVFALARRVAPTDGTVLLTGESGTGKEMFVRAIHRLSRRKDYPLLACDCSALAPTLLESELFGHVKGSFSGAIATKQGLFEAAHQGTLFLDEVANLSMETQGKLLRVLETKRVKKVGDTAEREVDIRLISATNRDLSEMVREGDFREDLYYRLNVVPIYLPPLRDRQGDIPRLAVSFLERFCKKNQVDAKGFTPGGDVPDGELRIGPATSASCGTSSSGWRFFATRTGSSRSICRKRSARRSRGRRSASCPITGRSSSGSSSRFATRPSSSWSGGSSPKPWSVARATSAGRPTKSAFSGRTCTH